MSPGLDNLTPEARARGVATLKRNALERDRAVLEAAATRTGHELADHLGVKYESARRILYRARRRLAAHDA